MLTNTLIPKLCQQTAEQNPGHQTFGQWMAQRQQNADFIRNSLPGNVIAEQPFEVHPYLHYRAAMLPNPAAYLIGTAPPASYLRSQVAHQPGHQMQVNGEDIGAAPIIDFFHGNAGSLWAHLNFNFETIEAILAELGQRCIVYSDVLASWSRNSITSTSDSDLTDLIIHVPLFEELWQRDDSPILWFTSSGVYNQAGIPLHLNQNQNGGFGRVQCHANNMKTHNVFLRGWQELGAELAVSLGAGQPWIPIAPGQPGLADFHHLLTHKLRVTIEGKAREFDVLTGPSPAGQANLRMANHPLYQEWLAAQPQIEGPPTNAFRQYVYQNFIAQIDERCQN